MVTKETRDQLFAKLEDAINLGGEKTAHFIDTVLDLALSGSLLFKDEYDHVLLQLHPAERGSVFEERSGWREVFPPDDGETVS